MKNTTRDEMRDLREGDKFVLNDIEHTASCDAYPLDDGDYVVYDEDDNGWFEGDFPHSVDEDMSGIPLPVFSLDARLKNGKFNIYLATDNSSGAAYNGLTAEEVGRRIANELMAYAEEYRGLVS